MGVRSLPERTKNQPKGLARAGDGTRISYLDGTQEYKKTRKSLLERAMGLEPTNISLEG